MSFYSCLLWILIILIILFYPYISEKKRVFGGRLEIKINVHLSLKGMEIVKKGEFYSLEITGINIFPDRSRRCLIQRLLSSRSPSVYKICSRPSVLTSLANEIVRQFSNIIFCYSLGWHSLVPAVCFLFCLSNL